MPPLSARRGAEKKPSPVWNRSYLQIALSSSLYHMAHAMHNSMLPLYLGSLGATSSLIGVMTSLNALVGMPFRLIFGRAMDRLGRRRVLLLGLVLVLACVLGFTPVRAVGVIVALHVLQGIGSSAVTAAPNVVIADVVDKAHHDAAFGYYSIFSYGANAIGPYLALLLISLGGYRLSLWTAAAFFALPVVVTLFMNYEKSPEFQRRREEERAYTRSLSAASGAAPEKRTGVWRYFEESSVPAAVVVLLMAAALAIGNTFLAPWATSLGVPSVGLFFTAEAGVLILARLFGQRAADRLGRRGGLTAGLLLMAAAFFMLARIPNLPWLICAGAIMGLGSALVQPILSSLVMLYAEPDRYGAASCTYYCAFDVGFVVGPLIGGFVVDAASYPPIFRIAACILLAGCLLGLYLFRRVGGEKA